METTRKAPKLLWAWTGLVLFSLYLPLAVMTANSFNASKFPYVWAGFTLRWYQELFSDTEVLGSLATSLWVGGIATLIAVALGTSAAMALHRNTEKRLLHHALEPSLMLPIILPDIVIAISLLLLFAWTQVELGQTTVILAHITHIIVYVFMIVRVRLRTLDPALEEAAKDLGASNFQTFRRVTFPLLFPGILAGGLLAFSISFEDFLVTFFTAGVGTTTLPIQIYSMMKYGVSPVINALSTLFLLLTIFASLGLQKVQTES